MRLQNTLPLTAYFEKQRKKKLLDTESKLLINGLTYFSIGLVVKEFNTLYLTNSFYYIFPNLVLLAGRIRTFC